MSDRRAISGSAPKHPESARRLEMVDPKTRVEASIVLRRRPGGLDISHQLFSPEFQPISRTDAAAQLGADPADIEAVKEYALQNGLEVLSSDPVTRTVKIAGEAGSAARALGVDLSWYEDKDGTRYMSYDGQLNVPEALADSIMAVTGLDSRPVARPR